MATFLDRYPPDWGDVVLQKLRDILASAIYHEDEIQLLVEDSGLRISAISWGRPADMIWKDVLTQCAHQGQVTQRQLIAKIRERYPAMESQFAVLLKERSSQPALGALRPSRVSEDKTETIAREPSTRPPDDVTRRALSADAGIDADGGASPALESSVAAAIASAPTDSRRETAMFEHAILCFADDAAADAGLGVGVEAESNDVGRPRWAAVSGLTLREWLSTAGGLRDAQIEVLEAPTLEDVASVLAQRARTIPAIPGAPLLLVFIGATPRDGNKGGVRLSSRTLERRGVFRVRDVVARFRYDAGDAGVLAVTIGTDDSRDAVDDYPLRQPPDTGLGPIFEINLPRGRAHESLSTLLVGLDGAAIGADGTVTTSSLFHYLGESGVLWSGGSSGSFVLSPPLDSAALFDHAAAHPRAEVRHAAMRVLASRDDVDAVPLLLDRLRHDEDVDIRLDAALALNPDRGPEVTDALVVQMVEDQSADVRRMAAEALAGRDDAEAVAALTSRATEDGGATVRQAAINALARHREPDVTAVLLDRVAGDPEANVRRSAARALTGHAAAEIDAVLMAALADDDSTVREAAVSALADRRQPQVTAALTERLRADEVDSVRRTAARALAGRKDPEVASALRSRIAEPDTDESATVRRAVVGALAGVTDAETVLTLTERMSDRDVGVRRAAAEALTDTTDPTAVSALIARIDDAAEHDDVRRAAANALGRTTDD